MTATQLLAKHGIKPNKSARAKAIVAERATEINKEIKVAKGPSRNDLMLKAKEAKIKYFRILSKKQLEIVLAERVHPDKIKAIQEEAVYAWKAGWKAKEVAVA